MTPERARLYVRILSPATLLLWAGYVLSAFLITGKPGEVRTFTLVLVMAMICTVGTMLAVIRAYLLDKLMERVRRNRERRQGRAE
jgi:spore maturation protein SpmB